MSKVCIINALDGTALMPLCTRNHQEVNKAMMESLANVVLNLKNKSQNTITSSHLSQQKDSHK